MRRESTSSAIAETLTVTAEVVALLPEYRQVRVLGSGGRQYALTRLTHGIDLATLRLGQRVECTVTARLSRVLNAVLID